MTNNTKIDELLAKYLAEENHEDDSALLNALLNDSDESDTLLSHSKLIWEASGAFQEKKKVDIDAAWTKVRAGMDTPKKKIDTSAVEPVIHLNERVATVKEVPAETPSVIRFWPLITQIAAMLVLLCGIGFWLYQQQNIPQIASLRTSSQQNTLSKTLPDGTRVLLNKNSSISFPEQFEGDTRQVTLEGEAFFEVHHDSEHPFIIKAKGTEIKVLGTSFNVTAYNTAVKVLVKTGKVRFSKNNSEVILTQGQQAEATAEQVQVSEVVNLNTLAYQSKTFVFDNTPLKEVAQILSGAFSQQVVLANPAIANCKLTATFEREKLANILSIIAETFSLKVETKGQDFVLQGNGCQ
jgi:ferric-dicitrate binding protein FerR (iron transport regulator)